MTFSQIPSQYAPLGAEVLYAVEHSAAEDLDIRIADRSGSTLYGTLRFVASAAARFDAAPFLRRALHFLPVVSDTGFYAATGRTVTATVAVGPSGTLPDGAAATAPERTFLAGRTQVAAPALLTTLPLQRLIPEGARDELTLLAPDSGTVKATVTARSADTMTAQSYSAFLKGPVLFVLDTRDFPGADTLTVEIDGFATVEYTVVPAAEQAVRVAWRSSAGSVEQYSFPVVRTTTVQVEKLRAEGPEGLVAVPRRREATRTLVSAYETEAMLTALAELVESPEVWVVGEDSCTPIDVATDEAVVRRLGNLCCLEIDIRDRQNTAMTWN